MRRITVHEFKQVLDTNADLQLVDVRSPGEYLAVRILQAQSLPLANFDRLSPLLNRQKEVYALCRTGRRAEEFCHKIDQLGFDSVLVEGGIEAWSKHYPVHRSPNMPWSIERQTRFGVGLLVFLSVVSALFVHFDFVYLAGFVGAGLMYAGATDFCGMSIILAKMPWNKQIASGTAETSA